jgi:GNAT superfamily N-acetyltransferase
MEHMRSPEYERLEWSVREARAEDAKEIAQLQSQLWQETYMRPGQDERNEYIFAESMGYLEHDRIQSRTSLIEEANKDQSTQSYFILEGPRGQIVGMLYGVHTAEKQEIAALFVDRVYQGEGGGKGLIDAFLYRCDETRPVELGVVDDNLNAQGFYERLGFEPAPNSLRKFDDYMNEIVMVRPGKNPNQTI